MESSNKSKAAILVILGVVVLVGLSILVSVRSSKSTEKNEYQDAESLQQRQNNAADIVTTSSTTTVSKPASVSNVSFGPLEQAPAPQQVTSNASVDQGYSAGVHVMADIEGNSVQEALVGFERNNSGTSNLPQTRLIVVSSYQSKTPSIIYRQDLPEGTSATSTFSIIDLNGDAKQEVLVTQIYTAGNIPYKQAFLALGADGKIHDYLTSSQIKPTGFAYVENGRLKTQESIAAKPNMYKISTYSFDGTNFALVSWEEKAGK